MEFYTDGNSLLNSKSDGISVGCYGWIGDDKESLSDMIVDSDSTTMEALAMFWCLKHIQKKSIEGAVIYCDSQSLVTILNNKNKQYKNNQDTKTRQLFSKLTDLNPEVIWVKGHSGSEGNNKIDRLLELKLAQSILELEPTTRTKILQKVKYNLEVKGFTQSFSTEFYNLIFNK